MRILLDENTPRGVRGILTSHDARTAPQMGWGGLSNSDLLDAAEQAGFEALVTCDQNMVLQQNLAGRNIAVVVLSTNTWLLIRAQPQIVQRAVANASPGTFTLATFGRPRRSRRSSNRRC
jgi:hypothetical protein